MNSITDTNQAYICTCLAQRLSQMELHLKLLSELENLQTVYHILFHIKKVF